MKVRALKVCGDGKRNYSEGEMADMTKELFEKINSTPNGKLFDEVKEPKRNSTKEE
jgi:hypothetical protein